jgi:alpha-tubulin suppressor-like RCC1 family protein
MKLKKVFHGCSRGGAHACALLADGTVVCWGANDLGQMPLAGFVFAVLLPRR